MTLTNAENKQWVKLLLKVISHVADEEYQRRVWFSAVGPEVDNFEETVNHFGDIVRSILEKNKEYRLSETQYKLIDKLWKSLRNYYPEPDDQDIEFISSPEWQQMIKMAQEVLKAFHYQKYPKWFTVLIDNDEKRIKVNYKFKNLACIYSDSTVQFYPPPEGMAWEFPFDDAIEALTRAKKELLEYLEEVAKP